MKRRLNLAVALIHEPAILLLDEPTVGVDPQSRNRLFESILELGNQGKTILYTTHYMEEAERLCHRVGIMDKGQLLLTGSVDELIARHGGEALLTWSADGLENNQRTEDPARDLQALLQEHPGVTDLRLTRPNLEHVFLNLTGRQLRD